MASQADGQSGRQGNGQTGRWAGRQTGNQLKKWQEDKDRERERGGGGRGGGGGRTGRHEGKQPLFVQAYRAAEADCYK